MRLSEAQFESFLKNSHCRVQDGILKLVSKSKKNRQISKLEELVYWEYLQSPNIKILDTQPKFIVMPEFTRNGRKHRAIIYTADFHILEDGKEWIVEVKSKGIYRARRFDYPMRRKLFLRAYPDLAFREIIVDDQGNRIIKEY